MKKGPKKCVSRKTVNYWGPRTHKKCDKKTITHENVKVEGHWKEMAVGQPTMKSVPVLDKDGKPSECVCLSLRHMQLIACDCASRGGREGNCHHEERAGLEEEEGVGGADD